MPTYEYACEACGETTEAYQSFTDPPLEECPHCGGHLKRVFHSVGVHFKGSGFYSTDAKSGTKASGNGKKPGAKPDSKDTSKDTSKASDPSSTSSTSSAPSSKASDTPSS